MNVPVVPGAGALQSPAPSHADERPTTGLGATGPAPAARVGESLVSVARVVGSTAAEGPGRRTAVWVQGCSVRCPACFNPHMWSTRGGVATQPEDLLVQIIAAETEGVTFLGGEPFDQSGSLAVLAAGVQAAGLSVMTFTGYTWEQLQEAVAAGRGDVAALLNATDLLVDGPYLADHPDRHRPWVGSTNQSFRFLTDRYARLRAELGALPDRVEVHVGADGQVAVNGWASVDALEELLDGLGRRVDRPRGRGE